MRRIVVLLWALSLSFTAVAQFRFNPVTVHPANPQSGQPILLLLRSFWNDGCGGTVDVRASAERVDVFQIRRTAPDLICTQAAVPLELLINPQEKLPANTQFANRVEVRLFMRNFEGVDELLDSDVVQFSSTPPSSRNVLSGSFSARTLDVSGLFIDQQEGVMSTLLSDYDEQGRSSWRFGAGKMHGDIYIGDLSRYNQIVCVRAPCPRVAANSVGKIYLIALNANELFVSYRDALAPDVSGITTHHYQRLVFNRGARLPGESSADAWIPDLAGEWLVGVTGTNTENAQFKRYRISYIGRLVIDPNGPIRFSAQSVTNRADGFEILCSDDRPVDGELGCRVESYSALQRVCSASIAPEDVVLGNLRVAAECDGVDTEFLMQRLGR